MYHHCYPSMIIILHLRFFFHIISALMACVTSLFLLLVLPFLICVVLSGVRYSIPPASSKRFPGFFSLGFGFLLLGWISGVENVSLEWWIIRVPLAFLSLLIDAGGYGAYT